MKTKLFLVLIAILLCGFYIIKTRIIPRNVDLIKLSTKCNEGDLIFQTSKSSQSKAIQLATNSPISHCGIIFYHKQKWMVLEAIEPVKYTILNEWIHRGAQNKFAILRLKNTEKISQKSTITQLKQAGNTMLGKHYDATFLWSDDKIYCSELIYKLYKKVMQIEIGKTSTIRDFDLDNPIVQYKLKQRYKGKIPYNETVITPDAIFKSPFLRTVFSNY